MKNDANKYPLENEVGKYKKKKQSNSSKSKHKSNHKHTKDKCLLCVKDLYINIHIAEYCSICGKIDNIKMLSEDVKNKEGVLHRKYLDKYEALSKYDLPYYEIDDLWCKYVPIEKEV